MKAEKKMLTGTSIAGMVYIEESVLWLVDRIIDLLLAYKDTLMQMFI